MLDSVTKKLCPMMTLLMTTIGCGKSLSDSKSAPDRGVQNQETPSAYSLRIDSSSQYKVQYALPKDTLEFEIPRVMKVRQGSAAGKVIDVSFNTNPYDSDDFEYKCSYIESTNPAEMKLSKCVDAFESDLGQVATIPSLEKDSIIQLKFSKVNSTDFIADIVFNMNWF